MHPIFIKNNSSWVWLLYYGFGVTSPVTSQYYVDTLNDMYTDNAGDGYTDVII